MSTLCSVALLAGVGVGCDASSVPGVGSNADASAGFRALLGALRGNAPSALVAGDAGPDAFREASLGDAGSAVDITAQCSGGGTVAFAGELTIEGAAGADLGEFDPLDPDQGEVGVDVPKVSFEYTVTFDGCQQGDVQIDGSMHWSLATAWDAEAMVLSMNWAFVGGVDFTGGATGHCEFDFQGDASSDDPQGWATAELESAQGAVCGYDAAEVIDQDA